MIAGNTETPEQHWKRAYNTALKDCVAAIRKMDKDVSTHHLSDKSTWYWDGAIEHVIKTIKKMV